MGHGQVRSGDEDVSTDTPQEDVKGLSDEQRRALSVQVHGVFADPKADSAAVLEAYIGLMVLNETLFYTASGELGLHLSRAVDALRNTQQPVRRFLGQPREG